MEIAIVTLVVFNILISFWCWLYSQQVDAQKELLALTYDYQEKLTKEIEHYKAVIRTEQSVHAAQLYELEQKLQAISAILNPEPATFDPYDTQDFHMADVLARHE